MIPGRSLDREIKLLSQRLASNLDPSARTRTFPNASVRTDRSFSVNTVVIIGLPQPLHEKWPSGQLQSSWFVR